MNKLRRLNVYETNALLLSLYIFQFGFLQPIASILNSQIPIAIFTLVLVFISLINNKFRINKFLIYTFLLISIFFMSNYFIYAKNGGISINIYTEFILKSFSGIIIASFKCDYNFLYKCFEKVSLINFISIALYPFVGFLDSMNYMRFGYAMLPSVMMFLLSFIKTNKFKYLVLFFISMFLMVFYGNRGTILPLSIFIIIIFLLNKKDSIVKKAFILLGTSILVLITYKLNLIGKIFEYIYLDLGIKTYSMMKLYMMFNVDFIGATSGRGIIYSEIFNAFNKSPLIGNGVGFSEISIGYTSHNFILQILGENGIIGMMIFLTLSLAAINKMSKIYYYNYEYFKIIIMILSISLGRLLVSSDIWLRPELWVLVSLLANYKVNVNREVKDDI